MSDEKKSDAAPSPKRAEPQSYGSEKGWLEGKTGQTVDRTPERTSRPDEEFYQNRHSATDAGTDHPSARSVSEYEADPPAPDTSEVPSTTTAISKQKTGSYFKDRDYSDSSK